MTDRGDLCHIGNAEWFGFLLYFIILSNFFYRVLFFIPKMMPCCLTFLTADNAILEMQLNIH